MMLLGAGFQLDSQAQIYRIGAGLSLATGFPEEFNYNTNGNPGFKLKTWYALDRKSSFHLVPTLTVFNKSMTESSYYSITNYMVMGDLDAQYMFFYEGTLKMVAFAGINYTHVISKVRERDPKYPLDVYAPNAPGDESDFGIGGNVGAGLEMRMGPKFDMNLQGKYILSKYRQFVISIEGVYYFKSRRRVMRR